MANTFRAAFVAGCGACVVLLALAAPVSAQDRMDKPVRILVGFAPGRHRRSHRARRRRQAQGHDRPAGHRREPARRRRADRRRRRQGGGAGRLDDHGDADRADGGGAAHAEGDPVRSGEGLHGDRPRRDVPVRACGGTGAAARRRGPSSSAWAKANPAKASYATSAAGSLPHFVGVLLSRDIGVDMVHVAYKGSAAYMNDLIGGQVPSAIDTVADLSELHRAGRIRILATTGATRAPATPDVPTFTRARTQERRRLRLVRLLRAGQHAEGGDRHAEPRDQQGADVARRRRAADEARHGSGDEHARGIRADRRFRLRQMGPDREGVGLHRRLDLIPSAVNGLRAEVSPVRIGLRATPRRRRAS